MYTNSSFQNVQMRKTSAGSKATLHPSSFDCSAQSILSAMNRFVGSVQSMQQTVLVPSRLRDLSPESTSSNGTQLPSALVNLDPYDLFAMLGDVRNELLWGASTGQSTVATMDSTSAITNVTDAELTAKAQRTSQSPLVKCQSSASLLQQSLSNSLAAVQVSNNNAAHTSGRQTHPHHLANQGKALSNGNLSKESLNASLATSRAILGQAMLSSDDGFGSLDSAVSSSDSLSESGESDCDSVLESTCTKNKQSNEAHCRLPHRALLLSSSSSTSTSQNQHYNQLHYHPNVLQQTHTQHCNSSHLATAFKYHLQGLHTILQQLSDSADFLVDQYQQEVMQSA